MADFIIEIVADFDTREEALATQQRIDNKVGRIKGSYFNLAIDTYERNIDAINELIPLAKAGNKTQMLLKLGQMLISGKIKL